MDEDQLPEKRLIEWASFFSEPAFDQTLLEQRLLLQTGYPIPLRLALWLDYFLIAGEDLFKKKWNQLSLEDRNILGIELLKCYLFQPLFLRLSPEDPSATKKLLSISKKSGKLLYPLAHHRLWPRLLTALKEGLFSSEDVCQGLQPGLMMTSSSRLETIRRRAETLDSFFSEWQRGGVSPVVTAAEQIHPGKNAPLTIEDLPIQTPEVVLVENAPDPIQSVPEESDLLPALPAPPKKKKKSKPSTDQLKLF